MNRKLALFDIDNTLYSGHVVTDFPKYLRDKKVVNSNVVEKQEKVYLAFQKGEIGYETLAKRWLICMAEGLKGLETEEVMKYLVSFFDNNELDYFMPITRYLKNINYDIYIVSGEPEFVSDYFVEEFELNGELSSTFELKDNKFTGEVGTLLSNKSAKHVALTDLFDKYDLTDSLAFGDSVVDLEMLARVDISICVNPSEELREIANNNKWIMTETKNLLKTIRQVTS